ncbi:MAG: release factor glutamine methyltransferase [Rhodospirillaceae bacterium]|jgi:release factor glutamine methyltransferase|nr:release factor glutamine methyltransferase [Rhodospirillaceae bacterium]
MSDIAETLADLADRFAAAGIAEGRRDARLLVSAATGLSLASVIAYPERQLAMVECRQLAVLADRRERREPISRILGWREFWSLRFALAPDTLDPRPDSETLIEAALETADRKRPLAVLDLGTGSGCLLLALLSELPLASGVGVDISADAVATATANAEALGLDGRARLRQGDWGEGIVERFDIVLCNPPYIPAGEIAGLQPEVARFDPPLALAGGADGLDAYRRLAGELPGLLTEDGRAYLEVGAGQAEAVDGILGRTLRPLGWRADLAGTPRCLALGRAGRRAGMSKK